MLNVAPVANAFLSYTWLGKCFFSDIFFSTSWLHFYFTGYLIMYWWKRSLWWQEGLQGNEDTRGVSEFCLFKGSFCWAIKWVECLIFHFIFTLQIKKKKKNWNFWDLENKFILKCINRVGVLINNPPGIQFSYKFDFFLCKNWWTSYKDITTLNR